MDKVRNDTWQYKQNILKNVNVEIIEDGRYV